MFVVCDLRKGSPRIDIRICKVCKEEKCKDRKRIQIERVPKFEEPPKKVEVE